MPWQTASQRHERHDEIYNADYYEFVEDAAVWSREAMANTIMRDLAPRHVLDIGCGTGALLDALRARSVQVAGLEYSEAALAFCERRSLPVYKFDITCQRLPFKLRRQDVVLSFEVAEHLPKEVAGRFIKLLSAAGDVVVLGAATPGQGGTDHINEQPHEHWIGRMANQGYRFDCDLTYHWRDEWRGRTADWYHANVMIFRRASRRLWAA